MSPNPRVVVTYAHGSHDRVCIDLSDRLRTMGVDCEIDAYEDAPEEGWGRWMTRMMTERIVLMVCDETYYRHFSRGSPDGVGRGVTFESGLLVQRFVESQGKNDFLYPVVRATGDFKWIPEFLRSATRFVIPDQYELLYRVLTKQPKHPRPPLGQIVRLDGSGSDSSIPLAPSAKRRVDDPYPMLTCDFTVPEDFVYVRITPQPPERVLIMTDAICRTIVDFVSSLPALSNLHAEPTRDGVLFVTDNVPEWRGDELRIDQYGGESARVQRARRQAWIRTDGDVEVRLPVASGNAVQQLVRTLATAWALATNFAPLFGAQAAYRGRFAYRLERLESGGFPVRELYQDWLDGDLTAGFADAFLGPLLETQSAGGHAGDPEETRKLLQSSWSNEIIRSDPATAVIRDSAGVLTVTVYESNGAPISDATVAAVSSNGTVISDVTDADGRVALPLVPGRTYTALVAHPRYSGIAVPTETAGEALTVSLIRQQIISGSVVGLNGVAYIPGLVGRINAIHDSLDRRYLYAENVSVNDSATQPANIQTGVDFVLEDATGVRCRVVVPFSLGPTFLLNYQFEARPQDVDVPPVDSGK